MAPRTEGPRLVTVAATQMAANDEDIWVNIKNGEKLVREAASKGAQIILLQELFGGPYFCQEIDSRYFRWARTVEDSEIVNHFKALAKELSVVLPISFYEVEGKAYYNSIAIIDADGSLLGVYRKTHIPESPGYLEKFYFTPGDTGFKVWKTKYATIGVAICWDQWFPETARSMALMGAELLFFPTAIGSEPQDATLDSRHHWQRVQQGHAGANLCPLIASNRIGAETVSGSSSAAAVPNSRIVFYGSSFIADHTGAKVAEADDKTEQVLVATFDLDAIDYARASWGIFRDRRPALYGPILTKDGKQRQPSV